MDSEKRKYLRVPLSVSVSYRVNHQTREEAYHVESVNIGEGGIFVKTDLPLGIGTDVELEFSLPNAPEPIRVCGKVVWSGGLETPGKGEVSGKGIRFTECKEHFRKLLTEYVQQASK